MTTTARRRHHLSPALAGEVGGDILRADIRTDAGVYVVNLTPNEHPNRLTEVHLHWDGLEDRREEWRARRRQPWMMDHHPNVSASLDVDGDLTSETTPVISTVLRLLADDLGTPAQCRWEHAGPTRWVSRAARHNGQGYHLTIWVLSEHLPKEA